MGFDDQDKQPQIAADFNELRLRVERLERELAELQQRPMSAHATAPPPPPIATPVANAEGVTKVTAEETRSFEPPVIPFTFGSVPPPPKASLENRIGSQLFNRIGIIALLIGTTWFLKLAIDNHWIGAAGRIVIGLIAGAGIIIWSERFRRQGVKAFSYSLKAIGSGVLYLSLWAAFQLYHLLPAPAALGAMILVTAWNAYMAWSQDAELLAAYALIGGFATPVLLSTGGNHEIFLFTYLLAINLAMVVLIRVKPWARLLLGAFPATVVYFIGWYVSFWRAEELLVTSVFLVLFGLIFASVSVGPAKAAMTSLSGQHSLEEVIAGIFLPLSNAAFVSLGFYSVLQDSGHHATLPWLMVVLAAAYLGLMRLPQSRVASAIHLSLAIVFLTIAIPLKASGHWLTVAWLVEGVALFWVSTRLASSAPAAGDAAEEPVSSAADSVLRWLSAAALVLGFGALLAVPYWFDPAVRANFFNHDFATALIGIAAFAGVAWLVFRGHKDGAPHSQLNIVVLAMIAVNVIAVLLSVREIVVSRVDGLSRTAFFNADFATALVGIAVLGAVAYVAIRISRAATDAQVWLQLAGASIIAINLVALLSGVREISSLWSYSADNPSGDLKQALAVSGFLMLYSAMLLAVGFWKRTAFIRWQGLILLVFTIGKTFLYDMSSLSQGYRVVSFLGLGVLLMAVSFAYQKDWLGLRDPEPKVAPAPVPETEK